MSLSRKVRRLCAPAVVVVLLSACAMETARAQPGPVPSEPARGESSRFAVEPFALGEVELLESPFRAARERNAKYLLELDPDRLLHNARKYAGLRPKGELYGGWEARGVAGHREARRAAEFFRERVAGHHSYVIGGNGEHEHFGRPDELAGRLGQASAESCNTYNMLRLTRHLFAWQPEARHFDFYERALQPRPRLAGAAARHVRLLRLACGPATSRPTRRPKTPSGAASARGWRTTRSTTTRSTSARRTRSTSTSSSPRA